MSRHIAWHHFQFDVPDPWELTSYSMESRAGRLEFSTRHGFQALISWEPCRRPPDTESMMVAFLNDHARRGSARDRLSLPDLKTMRAGPFLMGHVGPDWPCQAYAYLDAPSRLLRWIFDPVGPDCTRAEAWAPLLSSFRPNHGPWRDYALAGLTFRLPEDYELETMNVLPANVMMAFESRRRGRVTVRRWGLPERILNGDTLDRFHTRVLSAVGAVVREARTVSVRGMDGAILRYEERGEHHMDRFMGRLWEGEAYLWHNREERRLYAFEQAGPRGTRRLDREEVFP